MQPRLFLDDWYAEAAREAEQARRHRRAEIWRGVAGAVLGASAAIGLALGALWGLW